MASHNLKDDQLLKIAHSLFVQHCSSNPFFRTVVLSTMAHAAERVLKNKLTLIPSAEQTDGIQRAVFDVFQEQTGLQIKQVEATARIIIAKG